MIKIRQCYDSHLHLMATGEFETGLKLFDLNSPMDLEKMKLEKNFFRGEWLTGFGWNQYRFPNQQYPHAKDLDAFFPDFPVSMVRSDGHASWLNTAALKKIGYFEKTESEKPNPEGGLIVRDERGFPSGIFVDLAKIMVDQFIPPASLSQKKQFLKSAIHLLNSQGYTHVRDMSGSWEQWSLLKDLDEKNELTLYVEQNFSCEDLQDFEQVLPEVRLAQKHPSSHLRVAGIKVYFDGALGSEGASLSLPYPHSNLSGLELWSEKNLQQVIEKTWRAGLAIAIHGIGDAATSKIAHAAAQVQELGVQGLLNLEHGEMLAPETIELLRKLNVRIHMQPCHFLSDQVWLKEKLGDLYPRVFPWAALQKAEIPMSWGSDSPIERPSLFATEKALIDSAKQGIAAYQGNWWSQHQHPDLAWGNRCLTSLEQGKVKQVIFDGKQIL